MGAVFAVSRAIGILASALLAAGCVLPSLSGRSESHAYAHTDDTGIGKALQPLVRAHPGQSGTYATVNSRDAFAARVLLATAAQRSIDAQYYIWDGDHSGTLLLEALWHAAQRGVRVRLLLDDLGTRELGDSTVATLCAQPNIEVRLFNPLINRRARWTNYLFDFDRVNRRMHNKSFTIDNQVTVVGGRNVGDAYFDLGSELSYYDLDVIAVGPVVQETSDEFDLYWNSAAAYPAAALVGAPHTGSREQLEARFAAARADPVSRAYLDALESSALVVELSKGRLPLEWTPAQVVYDDPAKVLDPRHGNSVLLLSRLLEVTSAPRISFDLISPYFVPGSRGQKFLIGLAERGAQVRVLTNSLESTDVLPVYAKYTRRRKPLLRSGIRLYELQRKEHSAHRAGEKNGHFVSVSGLHAKTFQMDGTTAFIGSFNFDPRSARLNTEMGVVIRSPQLAHRIVEFFDSRVLSLAYEVRLKPNGDLEWIAQRPSGPRILDAEPGTSLWRRIEVGCIAILPIEGML